MTSATLSPARRRPLALPFGRPGWFLLTIFSSAFLLFMVQPMVARMALPRLGGAPSVWNSAMLVYQLLLLGGYAYAHALGRLAPRRQAMVHVTMLGLAGLTLPLALQPWTPPADGNAFVWVPWLFLASIGPLFFVMSAHAPLIQRWFALSGCGDPYKLYAASNAGSFLGLLAYPLLVEPLVGIETQSAGWSALYVLVALLVAGASLRLPAAAEAVEAKVAAAPLDWRQIGKWTLLAAVPSGLICSTTLHLTTDIVAMPLLWVVPLGLYLLSFSFAFADRRRGAEVATRLAPFALLFWAAGTFSNAIMLPMVTLAIALAGLFLVSTALHSKLFDSRPEPAQLTRFYMVMSAGGVLGGIFAALVAPMVFDWTYEHPILLLAAALLLPASANPLPSVAKLWAGKDGATLSRRLLLAGLAVVAAVSLAPPSKTLSVVSVSALLILGVLAIGRPKLLAALIGLMMLASGGIEKLALSIEPGRMTRSFFGIYAVMDGPNASRMIVHGTTSHGIENLGSPEREKMATAYYAPRSGVGLAMAAKASLFPHARVSVVGLGAGTLACYKRPDEAWSFFEIDPAIVTIAEDANRFRFLARCAPGARTVVGDARLTLGSEATASADMLVVDAFSSDSVPMHLLTREAMRGYRRVLAPNGLLMIHISNRYLDLEPVIAAATLDGWKAQSRTYWPDAAAKKDNASPSQWVALSTSQATLDKLSATSQPGDWTPLQARKGFAPWTDSHSTILPLIKWGS